MVVLMSVIQAVKYAPQRPCFVTASEIILIVTFNHFVNLLMIIGIIKAKVVNICENLAIISARYQF